MTRRIVACPADLAAALLGHLAVVSAAHGVRVDLVVGGLAFEGPDEIAEAIAEGAREFVGAVALRAVVGGGGEA